MENETLYETAKFYKEKNRAVHIKTKNGRFYNGIILEVKTDFIILEDEQLGEMPLFFIEFVGISPRKPREVLR